jgi:hypothetical protein
MYYLILIITRKVQEKNYYYPRFYRWLTKSLSNLFKVIMGCRLLKDHSKRRIPKTDFPLRQEIAPLMNYWLLMMSHYFQLLPSGKNSL